MKVKRTAWHYKVRHFGRDFVPYNDNLCRYFWGVVGTLGLASFVGFCLIGFMYMYLTNVFVVSTTIMIIFVLSSFILPLLTIHCLRKKFGKSPEMPYGNIFIEYMRAKKRKVCPLIEYVD